MTQSGHISRNVPMLFRAQIDERCQLQRLQRDEEPHIIRWADEWVERTYPDAPEFGADVQSQTYQINWRFLSNSGQDDSVIRPVIGARGWPFLPGSSMKGVFRRACLSDEERNGQSLGMAQRYCGTSSDSDDLRPGILRFHGGYPTDTAWTENLVDIVHPQQDWQVKSSRKSGGAFALISLHEPEFQFGISSTVDLDESEWETIWSIWERALAKGIGGRVSAGYGQPASHKGDVVYSCGLKGQGQAPKLFDGTGEFRPNMFRAGIRGHALRIFGGLTTATVAEQAVEVLFGGVQGGATVGLLSMAFRPSQLDMDSYGSGSYAQPTYKVEGELSWSLVRSLESEEQRQSLVKLIEALTRFAMVLGGFGKSWRRADHRLFLPEYYDQGYKPLIGCHWQWTGTRSLMRDVKIRKIDHANRFINEVRQVARDWLALWGFPVDDTRPARWREAWHPDRVQVWGRPHLDANRTPVTAEQCEAIRWLHQPYRQAFREANIRAGTIYQSSLTGKMNQVGRIWHRMYPFVNVIKDKETGKGKPRTTPAFFEWLTIFPDGSEKSDEFLHFLDSEQRMFQKVWPSV